jgi:hypothetical protein
MTSRPGTPVTTCPPRSPARSCPWPTGSTTSLGWPLEQTLVEEGWLVPPGTAPHYDPGVLTEPAEIRLHDTLGKTSAVSFPTG